VANNVARLCFVEYPVSQYGVVIKRHTLPDRNIYVSVHVSGSYLVGDLNSHMGSTVTFENVTVEPMCQVRMFTRGYIQTGDGMRTDYGRLWTTCSGLGPHVLLGCDIRKTLAY
jgi:hypothetical protein